MFPNSIRDKGGGYSNYEIRIPSFDGNLDIKSSLFWIDEVNKLLNVVCIPMEDHVEFVAYKLKGRASTWWKQLQNIRMYQGKPPIRTWRRMKKLLQTRCIALEEEEMEIRPPAVMRSYRSNKIAE